MINLFKGKFAKIWRILSLSRDIQLWIMRLTQAQFLVGVTGVIFNDRDEVLLFKHTYRQTQWSLPGGYIKSKEHPYEALEREIKEESDLTVCGEEQYKIRTDRETSRLDITVIGKYIVGEFKSSTEVSEYGFFPFSNLPAISKNQLLLISDVLQSRKSINKENVKIEPLTLFSRFSNWFR